MDKIQWVAFLMNLQVELGRLIREVDAGALKDKAVDLQVVIERELNAMGYG